MSGSLTVFLEPAFKSIETIVEAFKEEFEIMLGDLFSEEELIILEPKLDAIAAVYVHPLSSGITFDDFYFNESQSNEQRAFFNSCKSTISFENLPFFENNPFQVTYLKELFKKFDNFLLDRGGTFELMDKDEYLEHLAKFKDIDSLIGRKTEITYATPKKTHPVDPVDFLIADVYKEFNRLKDVFISNEDLSEKVRKIYIVMKFDKNLDADSLLRKTSLNAKDLDDGLERLKFFLRKF